LGTVVDAAELLAGVRLHCALFCSEQADDSVVVITAYPFEAGKRTIWQQGLRGAATPTHVRRFWNLLKIASFAQALQGNL
jgi:hypothetical protein